MWPFEDLDILQPSLEDNYILKVTTFENRCYKLIFKRRISYSDINEFSIFKIIEITDSAKFVGDGKGK